MRAARPVAGLGERQLAWVQAYLAGIGLTIDDLVRDIHCRRQAYVFFLQGLAKAAKTKIVFATAPGHSYADAILDKFGVEDRLWNFFDLQRAKRLIFRAARQ